MKNEKKIKVLVADNSEFARNNLKKFLENFDISSTSFFSVYIRTICKHRQSI